MSVVLITGSKGLVGSAFSFLKSDHEMIFVDRSHADLTQESDVFKLYEKYRPDYVIHTAARVGGIGLNLTKPAELYYDNIMMNSFMIHYAHKFNVKKIICFTSVCSFPCDVPLLIESVSQDGKPFIDNFAYGYAKRMVEIQLKAYGMQYGTNYCVVVPTNIYGPNDNFNLQFGHVIPSLIHKCYLAKMNKTTLNVWGDGNSLREFIYSIDLARITMQLLEVPDQKDVVLVSNNTEYSIKQVVQTICKYLDFPDDKVIYDATKPHGQFRRPSDISKLKSIVRNIDFIPFEEGIEKTVKWFVDNFEKVRK